MGNIIKGSKIDFIGDTVCKHAASQLSNIKNGTHCSNTKKFYFPGREVYWADTISYYWKPYKYEIMFISRLSRDTPARIIANAAFFKNGHIPPPDGNTAVYAGEIVYIVPQTPDLWLVVACY